MTTQLLNSSATTLFHFECRDQLLLTPYMETVESDQQIKLYLLMIHPCQNVVGNHTSRTHTIYNNSAKGEVCKIKRSLRI